MEPESGKIVKAFDWWSWISDEKSESLISADGWTLKVAAGWVVRDGARKGDYEVVKRQPVTGALTNHSAPQMVTLTERASCETRPIHPAILHANELTPGVSVGAAGEFCHANDGAPAG